ncbi:MAG: crossover junction endodeoxyribonuclease RuvC [Candidatus Kerfeldbacteria bacterium]|nr:crossover junction endodeoxyribonuclease RuvC [Candidatus Kerfeldbacteria bacterium]
MSSRTILGIDPGISRMGYAILEVTRGSLKLKKFGVIETSKGLDLGDRLHRIYRQVRSLISSFHPDTVALETLAFSRNVTTALAVGEASGVVRLAAAESNIPVKEFSPLEVKQSITGYGRADKRQVQRMIQAIFSLKHLPSPDDAADAIAIAVCGSRSQFTQPHGKPRVAARGGTTSGVPPVVAQRPRLESRGAGFT